MYYLGKYGSTASRPEYDRIIAEFVANGRQPFAHPDTILVESLIVRYLIPADIAAALKMVQQLRKGRTAAVEYDDIQPVADAVVEATLPHLSPNFSEHGSGAAVLDNIFLQKISITFSNPSFQVFLPFFLLLFLTFHPRLSLS